MGKVASPIGQALFLRGGQSEAALVSVHHKPSCMIIIILLSCSIPGLAHSITMPDDFNVTVYEALWIECIVL